MKLRLTAAVLFLVVGTASAYWSDWSVWSACSRTCENGLQYRTRRCIKGDCPSTDVAKETRVCNDHKPCHSGKSFRDEQCEQYTGKRLYGKRRTWTSYFDSGNLCSLTCKSTDNFVAVLREKVDDGTPCSEGSSDVCMDGVCKAIGCDNVVGSNKVTDECGICGGNGLSCRRSRRYQWTPVLDGVCSVTCGTGMVNIKFICEDTKNHAEVDEFYCKSELQPKETNFVCNQNPCNQDNRWIAEPWGDCSSTCGHGVRHRNVTCSDGVSANKLPDDRCGGSRPRSNELCHLVECDAQYVTGDWSECSATCGEGVRSREVVCLDSKGLPSKFCDTDAAPSSFEVCQTEQQCGLKNVLTVAEPFFLQENVAEGEKKGMSSKGQSSKNPVSQDANFAPGEWNPCSVTCGEGTKTRTVSCQLYLAASKRFAEVPDSECRGEKPQTSERCLLSPCSFSRVLDPLPTGAPETNEIPDDWAEYDYDSSEVEPPILLESLLKLEPDLITIYEWQPVGFSDCSASCLGENVTVDESSCVQSRPSDVYQVCNEGPCPPKWNVTEWGDCSSPCGGGVQTRQVTCMQDVADGLQIQVPEEKCPVDLPALQQICNVLDCPAKWRAGNWSKCFKADSQCVRKREVICAVASDRTEWEKAGRSNCSGRAPKNVGMCLPTECKRKKPESKAVTIEGNPPHHKFYQKPNKKMVLLTIGGSAEVIKGTWLTVKCPVKGFPRSKIKWFKDDSRISDQDRIEVTHSGNLLIYDVMVKDSGTYKCKAGRVFDTIAIRVRNKSSFSKAPNPRQPSYNEIPQALKAMSQTLDLSLEDQISLAITNPDSKEYLEKSLSKALSSKELIPKSSFDWLVAPWSQCSQLCGSQAFQVRAVNCVLRWKNVSSEVTLDVKPNICELAGLPPKPHTRQRCGMQTCPKWEVGFWSKCEESKCLTYHTAVQVREVNCVSSEGQIVEESFCKAEEKPLDKQKCRSRLCEGVWRSEEWSECQARCGEQGIRTRLVLCVWKRDTTSLAGNICPKEIHLVDKEDCEAGKCGENGECTDSSVFCNLVPLIKMCNSEQYIDKCCLSCSTMSVEVSDNYL